MASIKRQAELVEGIKSGKTKATGRGYRSDDVALVAQMAVSAGYVSVVILALYTRTPLVRDLYAFPGALWGICLMLMFWLSRAALKTHRGEMNEDPIVFAIKDRVSRICIVLMISFGLLAVYYPAHDF